MKQIKTCPLPNSKCTHRISNNLMESGCILYSNVNLCNKCTKFRKKYKNIKTLDTD